jgi:hypothetical protein
VSDYQSKNSSIAGGAAGSSRIETVADMKRFVEEYPEFRRLGGNVTKHVTLVGELSRLVERDDLLAVSEVEQSLASQESHQADLRVSTIPPRQVHAPCLPILSGMTMVVEGDCRQRRTAP